MAGAERPVVLIAVFSETVLQRILDTIAAGEPPVGDWFIGTFGMKKAVAEKITKRPRRRYAPVFPIQAKDGLQTRLRRRLSQEAAALLDDAAHAGEIPGSSAGQAISPVDRRVWGIELGRRFRDEIRAARAKGIPVATWQFDEILGECGRSGSSNPHREFIGGVLRGLAVGRPQLGDTHEKGFVWAAHTAMTGLPGLPISGDLRRFWQDLDAAARFLVGEEYPEFTGDPAGAARAFCAGHQALARKPGIRRKLADRYLVGMTPGWRPRQFGLGGNVAGKSPAEVTQWRNGFIDERIGLQRPRGFAQFNFAKENTRSNRVEDAVRSLHHARQLNGH
jgi:hypothetical protein